MIPSSPDELRKLAPVPQPLQPRAEDRFVPVRSVDLAAVLAAERELFGEQAAELLHYAGALRDVIRQEADAFERLLMDDYAPFDPDRDTNLPPGDIDGSADERLLRNLGYVLEKANFEHMPAAELEAVVAQANSLGLRVLLDPARVKILSIWIRGKGQVAREHRHWSRPLSRSVRVLETFSRLVVIYQLRDNDLIHLKMFKDIPTADVEALLPHAEVRMTLFDQAQLYVGSAGALGGTLWKLSHFLLYGAVQVTAMLTTMMAGAMMLTFKAFTGYHRTRMKRDFQRTRHLYFQNVANNASVVHSLLGMIVEEETKEALLGYAFCWAQGQRIASGAALRKAIEGYLYSRFGVSVRFDVDDAIETLQRVRLHVGVSLRVPSIDDAVAKLRQHWAQRASLDYHQTMAERSSLTLRTTLRPPSPGSSLSTESRTAC